MKVVPLNIQQSLYYKKSNNNVGNAFSTSQISTNDKISFTASVNPVIEAVEKLIGNNESQKEILTRMNQIYTEEILRSKIKAGSIKFLKDLYSAEPPQEIKELMKDDWYREQFTNFRKNFVDVDSKETFLKSSLKQIFNEPPEKIFEFVKKADELKLIHPLFIDNMQDFPVSGVSQLLDNISPAILNLRVAVNKSTFLSQLSTPPKINIREGLLSSFGLNENALAGDEKMLELFNNVEIRMKNVIINSFQNAIELLASGKTMKEIKKDIPFLVNYNAHKCLIVDTLKGTFN